MRIVIPQHFYVNRRKWTVELVRERIYAADGDEAVGLCHPDTRLIEISARIGIKRQVKILIHEYIHALEFDLGIKISHETVYALEKPLLAFFTLLFQEAG